MVPRLVEFIAQNGGSIDRAKLSIFLQKYPKSKSNLGDLYAFCARHKQHFCIARIAGSAEFCLTVVAQPHPKQGAAKAAKPHPTQPVTSVPKQAPICSAPCTFAQRQFPPAPPMLPPFPLCPSFPLHRLPTDFVRQSTWIPKPIPKEPWEPAHSRTTLVLADSVKQPTESTSGPTQPPKIPKGAGIWVPKQRADQVAEADLLRNSTPAERQVGLALADFVKAAGGFVKIGDAAWGFFSRYPEHKAALGNVSFMEFCHKQPDLFYLNHEHTGEAILSLACQTTDMPSNVATEATGPSANEQSRQACIPGVKVREALVQFIQSHGGSIGHAEMGKFLQNSAYKKQMFSNGQTVSQFCRLHEDFFIFERSSTSPAFRVSLRSAAAPATQTSESPDDDGSDSESSFASGEEDGWSEISVKQIKWAQDSIKVQFRNGWLLVDTLKDLVDGRLKPSQLPPFAVWQRGSEWFAITGNRRLWVLKELAELLSLDLRIRARVLPHGAGTRVWFQRKFTTRCEGNWVSYRSKGCCFPSMGFAMFVQKWKMPVTSIDLTIGEEIRKSPGGVPLEDVREKFTELSPVDRYLLSKPGLYSITSSQRVVFAPVVKAPAVKAPAPPPKPPIKLVGEFVTVWKHTSMGCAIVSMTDVNVREAMLAQGKECTISNVSVQINPHVNKDTAKEILTDLFVAWGHQVEKATPLFEEKIVEYFDKKHKEIATQWRAREEAEESKLRHEEQAREEKLVGERSQERRRYEEDQEQKQRKTEALADSLQAIESASCQRWEQHIVTDLVKLIRKHGLVVHENRKSGDLAILLGGNSPILTSLVEDVEGLCHKYPEQFVIAHRGCSEQLARALGWQDRFPTLSFAISSPHRPSKTDIRVAWALRELGGIAEFSWLCQHQKNREKEFRRYLLNRPHWFQRCDKMVSFTPTMQPVLAFLRASTLASFPCPMFAIASLDSSTAPSLKDLTIGWFLKEKNKVNEDTFKATLRRHSYEECKLKYLRQRPHLFSIVDKKVSLPAGPLLLVSAADGLQDFIPVLVEASGDQAVRQMANLPGHQSESESEGEENVSTSTGEARARAVTAPTAAISGGTSNDAIQSGNPNRWEEHIVEELVKLIYGHGLEVQSSTGVTDLAILLPVNAPGSDALAFDVEGLCAKYPGYFEICHPTDCTERKRLFCWQDHFPSQSFATEATIKPSRKDMEIGRALQELSGKATIEELYQRVSSLDSQEEFTIYLSKRHHLFSLCQEVVSFRRARLPVLAFLGRSTLASFPSPLFAITSFFSTPSSKDLYIGNLLKEVKGGVFESEALLAKLAEEGMKSKKSYFSQKPLLFTQVSGNVFLTKGPRLLISMADGLEDFIPLLKASSKARAIPPSLPSSGDVVALAEDAAKPAASGSSDLGAEEAHQAMSSLKLDTEGPPAECEASAAAATASPAPSGLPDTVMQGAKSPRWEEHIVAHLVKIIHEHGLVVKASRSVVATNLGILLPDNVQLTSTSLAVAIEQLCEKYPEHFAISHPESPQERRRLLCWQEHFPSLSFAVATKAPTTEDMHIGWALRDLSGESTTAGLYAELCQRVSGWDSRKQFFQIFLQRPDLFQFQPGQPHDRVSFAPQPAVLAFLGRSMLERFPSPMFAIASLDSSTAPSKRAFCIGSALQEKAMGSIDLKIRLQARGVPTTFLEAPLLYTKLDETYMLTAGPGILISTADGLEDFISVLEASARLTSVPPMVPPVEDGDPESNPPMHSPSKSHAEEEEECKVVADSVSEAPEAPEALPSSEGREGAATSVSSPHLPLDTLIYGMKRPASFNAPVQKCICDLSLLSKLPGKVLQQVTAPVLAEMLHKSCAQRLILQAGRPLQVALRKGYLNSASLPEVTLTPPDLVEMLKQLDVNVPTGSTMVQIPNSWHRLSCSYRGGELDVLVLHLTRILPGIALPVAQQAKTGSSLFLGPACSGKSTVLRDVAVGLSKTEQVVYINFWNELGAGLLGLARVVTPGDKEECLEFLDRVIMQHSPEVIVAEFLDASAALWAARRCTESAVRLVASLRGSMQTLLEEALVGMNRAAMPGCVYFPFNHLILLRRELDYWNVDQQVGATVCRMARGRCPACPHQSQVQHQPLQVKLKPLQLEV